MERYYTEKTKSGTVVRDRTRLNRVGKHWCVMLETDPLYAAAYAATLNGDAKNRNESFDIVEETCNDRADWPFINPSQTANRQ